MADIIENWHWGGDENTLDDFDLENDIFDQEPKKIRYYGNPAVDEHETLEPDQQPHKATQKTGRNDPCPCGSGKKYKKCCMNKT